MKNKAILFLVFTVLSITAKAQVNIKARICDAGDGTPISFCSIAIKGTTKGCLSNEDGYFTINADTTSDILVFYSLGYEKKEVTASAITGLIRLKQSAKELGEVIIHAEDDRLYDLLLKCRKNIMTEKRTTSKAYFQLTTKADKEPVEMLECYYNATTKGSGIKALELKNGRIGLAQQNGRYFVNINTSRAISYVDLVKENEYLPALPLQFSKRAMKQHYYLRQISEDDNSYNISFTPKQHGRSYFNGEIWIDKKNSLIQKIQLNCTNALVHPFVAFAEDTLKKVSMYITQAYDNSGNENRLSHINFSYALQHKSIRSTDSSISSRVHDLPERNIRTKGIIYFYDHEEPFILPFYQYDQNFTDLRKLSLIPYDPAFWRNATSLLYTEEQQKTIEFIEQKGTLVNFNKHKFSDSSRNGFFENNNFIWTDSTRINYERNNVQANIAQSSTNARIAVQIYFDINETQGKITHFSASVFDAMNTYIPEPEDPVMKCFMNLYFDIYEIERRKMEQKLSEKEHTIAEITAIYLETQKKIKQTIAQFNSEVDLGKNIEGLKQWNEYCRQQLGFDNIRIFNVEVQ